MARFCRTRARCMRHVSVGSAASTRRLSRQFSSGASPGSVWLSGLPDFLAGPLPGPFEAGQRVPRGRVWPGLDLDEVGHLETAATQQPDHVAVADVELYRVGAFPLEAVHAEIGPLQLPGGGQIVLVGHGEDELDGAG